MTKSRGIYKRRKPLRLLASMLDHENVIPEPNTGCWLWTGSIVNHGYGELGYQGKRHRAHRLSWEMQNGPMPKELYALHKCHTPCCVNPEHIYAGTPLQNMRDMIRAGRDRKARGKAHPRVKLTESAVIHIRELCSGGMMRKDAAKIYGVTTAAIESVMLRKTWKYI